MEENRSNQCTCCQICPQRAHGGYRLLLVSITAQWLVILACLVYMGVHSHRPPGAQEKKEDPLYTEIELFKGSDSDRGKPLTLMWRFGKRNIENNSVIITKDGCYLLCLRGSLESEGDKAAVEVHSKSNGGPAVLIFEGQMTNREMNLLTLQRLLKGDTMYVTVTGDSTVKLLNLSLKLTFLSEIPFDEGDPTPQ